MPYLRLDRHILTYQQKVGESEEVSDMGRLKILI